MKAPRSRGFTLIELVIVIAIVALLSLMLLPALASAKTNPLKAQCASRIKQVMVGITLFASDHDGRMPYNTDSSGNPNGQALTLDVRSSWPNSFPTRLELGFHLAPYLPSTKQLTFLATGVSGNEVLVCPAFAINPQYVSRAPSGSDVNNLRRMYRLRRYVEGSVLWTYAAPKLAAIQQPATNGAIADLDRSFPGGSVSTLSGSWSQLPDKPVHSNTRNYGFFDGHVDTLSVSNSAHATTMTTNATPYGWLTSTQ